MCFNSARADFRLSEDSGFQTCTLGRGHHDPRQIHSKAMKSKGIRPCANKKLKWIALRLSHDDDRRKEKDRSSEWRREESYEMIMISADGQTDGQNRMTHSP